MLSSLSTDLNIWLRITSCTLGSCRFNLQATVDHHEPSVYSDHLLYYLYQQVNAISVISVTHQVHQFGCTNLSWGQWTMGVNFILAMPAHLSILFYTGQGIGSETCVLDTMFPLDHPNFDSGTESSRSYCTNFGVIFVTNVSHRHSTGMLFGARWLVRTGNAHSTFVNTNIVYTIRGTIVQHLALYS